MRRITKSHVAPHCLRDFISRQQAMGPPVVNLTYNAFQNPGRGQLRNELCEEQFGLCGYTGAPVDDRIADLPVQDGVKLEPAIEHLKPQSVCRDEVEKRGLEYGSVPGDDLDYCNMIAVLKVNGAKREQFGEAIRGDAELPVWPTHEDCERRFQFNDDGTVDGCDDDAEKTIKVLKLDHDTLIGWRKTAVEVFLDPDAIETQRDVEELVAKLGSPADGDTLPEFAFVIRDVAERLYLP